MYVHLHFLEFQMSIAEQRKDGFYRFDPLLHHIGRTLCLTHRAFPLGLVVFPSEETGFIADIVVRLQNQPVAVLQDELDQVDLCARCTSCGPVSPGASTARSHG